MAGMMLGRPFRGDTEDDLAWCGVEDELATTTGGCDPVATTGVVDGFFAVPTAEAYDGAEAAVLMFDAGVGIACAAGEVISDNLLALQEQ